MLKAEGVSGCAGFYRNIQANLAGNDLPVSTALTVVVKPLSVLTGTVTGALVPTGGASSVLVASGAGVVAGRFRGVAGFGVGAGAMVGRATMKADESVGTRFVGQELFSL